MTTSVQSTSSGTIATASTTTGSTANTEDRFLKLLVAQMQNQDPLNPMDNSQMLEQLSQMRSISASDKLTTTLDAVLLGQNLTTASSLIGKEVSALTDAGSNVQGVIDRVTVAPGKENDPATVQLHIGDKTVSLSNVREIIPAAASS